MVRVRFQTVTQTEIDTETGKSRIIKSFTTPVGKGSKMTKKKPEIIQAELVEKRNL